MKQIIGNEGHNWNIIQYSIQRIYLHSSIQIMNIDNSFGSEGSDKSPNRKESQLLCSEIQQCGFNGEFNHSVDLSADSHSEEENQPQKFTQPQILPKQVLEQQPKESPQNEKVVDDGGQQQSSSGPKTITLIEDTLMSKETGTVSSKLSQYNSSISNQSYSSFFHMKQTVYEVHRRNYEQLFYRASQIFSQRLTAMSETYVTFLKVKMEQEKAYAQMCIDKSQPKRSRQINSAVYMNCIPTISQIRTKNKQECQKLNAFGCVIEQLYERAGNTFRDAEKVVKGKEKYIEMVNEKLIGVSEQMDKLMLPKEKGKIGREYEKFYGNSYVISKCLIKKEHSYLDLLKKFTQSIISYINAVCTEIQPKICIFLKEILTTYVSTLNQYKPSARQTYNAECQILNKVNCFQTIYTEIIEILLECIPKSLMKATTLQKQIHSDQYLESIIEKLNYDVQTFIYLPCIQVDRDNFVYSSEDKVKVKWIKAGSGKIEENHEKVINLILTKENHLILQVKKEEEERDDCIATIKLSDIKMSRKDNKIVLTDRGKGVIGFFLSSNSILGELIFQPLEVKKEGSGEVSGCLQEFIEKVKEVVKEKKNGKG